MGVKLYELKYGCIAVNLEDIAWIKKWSYSNRDRYTPVGIKIGLKSGHTIESMPYEYITTLNSEFNELKNAVENI